MIEELGLDSWQKQKIFFSSVQTSHGAHPAFYVIEQKGNYLI
jgi:hypothetical protein